MKRLGFTVIAISILVGAAPAIAGGISSDLPRLTFPAPQPDASRDCTTAVTVPPTCGQAKS